MKIDLSQFSHLQSELPKQDKRKIKIYIAYKADVSRYIAYAIYKIICDSEYYELYYDRALIDGGDYWNKKLDKHMNQCDIVLIIGQIGMLDFITKGEEDEFIKEIKAGYNKGKLILYVAVDNYAVAKESRFKDLLPDETEKISEIHSFEATTLDNGQNIMDFEEKIIKMKNLLEKNYEEYFKNCRAQRLSQELREQSTKEQQRMSYRGQSLL